MRRVLFLGSHCDDIELGCGATIAKHLRKADWLMSAEVFSCVNLLGERLNEVAETALAPVPVRVNFFPAQELHRYRQVIWEQCRRLQATFAPDLVFVNSDDDCHPDHQVLCAEACRKTFTCSIVCYAPLNDTSKHNIYEAVSEEDVEAKLRMLTHYECYKDKPYMQPAFTRAKMLMAGSAIGAPYAESFYAKRLVNGL